MKNNFNQLPSGKVVQTDDIIYISNIEENNGSLSPYNFSFKITWASRATEILQYKDKYSCMQDWSILKKVVMPEMIYDSPKHHKDENMIYD